MFEGRVIAIKFVADSAPVAGGTNSTERPFRWTDLVATVAVARRWKGELPATVIVRTAEQTTMCGAELKEGRSYLFFASTRGYAGLGENPPATSATLLETSKCSLTRGWDPEAQRLARLLGEARQALSRTER